MSGDELHSSTHSDADSAHIVEQLRPLPARNDEAAAAISAWVRRAMVASILSGKDAHLNMDDTYDPCCGRLAHRKIADGRRGLLI